MYYQNQNNPNNTTKSIVSPPDKILALIATSLVVIGIMAVVSAGSATAISEGLTPGYYILKHLEGLAVGIIACIALLRYDYKKLRIWALPAMLLVIVMLVLTKFTPLGYSANGARRWLNLGIKFQPSEFAKLALVLCLSDAFSKGARLLDERKYLYYILFGVMLLLILTQPNLSMAVLLCSCSAAVYFCAGGSVKLILSSITAAICMAPFFLIGYQKERVLMWLNPKSDPLGKGYNILQSLVAFASGGLFGSGYGNSKQKLSWLPEGHTDFIFAVWAEEFGFLGCVLLIALFFAFIRRGCIIATRCQDPFGKLLAFGITFSIGMQAFINMGVASAFIPATGVPLPFVSFGSSSLVVSLAMLGILLNISRKKINKITPQGLGYEQ